MTGPDAVVAVASGNRPFSDSVVLIPVGRGYPRTLLAARGALGYSAVSALSIDQPMVVEARKLGKGGTVRESLLDYDAVADKLTPSRWEFEGPKGMGTLSPDGRAFAFPELPSSEAVITVVSYTDKGARLVSRIQDPASPDTKAWYLSLSWSRDGRRIAAVKACRGKNTRLRTQLQIIDVLSKDIRSVLQPEDGITAVSLGAGDEAAILGARGLERLDLKTEERAVLLPVEAWKGRIYRGGGISWLVHSGSVVVSFVDQPTSSGEIWRIGVADTSVEIVHRVDGATFSHVCAVSMR